VVAEAGTDDEERDEDPAEPDDPDDDLPPGRGSLVPQIPSARR
jgi:hypothetical protein